MASPLFDALHAIEQAAEPVRLDELARRLGIEPSALAGMIDFWVQRGRIRLEGDAVCSSGGCGACPTGEDGCPLLLKGPRKFRVQGR